MAGREDTHFGEKTVPLADKQGLVDDVFHSVAHRYDLMNDLMSGGLHRAWKDALVSAVHPPKGDRPFALLDLAGGTGDVAFRVVEAGGPGVRVIVCDINAEALPYPDRHFDCVTIAFGIRNVPRIERALAEAYRVLRIGGRFLCLEFSSVDLPGLSSLYDVYSYNVIPRIGEAVTGDREAYQYLVESIRKFPKPPVFAKMIEAAGFRRVSFSSMTAGVVALHSGWKL